jgi:hypothetical protein
LAAEGFLIARYWNNDVLQRPSNVLEDISQSSPGRKNPSPVASLREAPPSPTRGEGIKIDIPHA